MILYAMIMFATAVLFAVVAVLIYKGKTQLIHEYHQEKVTDKVAYGKAFSKALGIVAVSMALSGAVALFDAALVAVCVLFAGLIVGIFAIFRVQKKYNGGVF